MKANYSPARPLKNIWLEWIELHKMLERGMRNQTTAPFFSAAASNHPDDCVLFVGKATAGDYWTASYRNALRRSEDEAIRERLTLNRQFIWGVGNKSAFWRFFNQVAKLRPDMHRDGVIWSNVAKIGSRTGNPNGLLLSVQGDLARRTLVEEVREYKPLVVVFVTGTYAESIIKDAFGFWSNEGWTDGDPEGNVSWCGSSRDFPKTRFLWMRHPQGKLRGHIDECTQRTWDLIMA